MSGVRGAKQLTANPHLNLYEMEAEKRNGQTFPYFNASRAKNVSELKFHQGISRPDGVIIYALWGQERDRVVLIRQMRYTVGRYIYEFPAGLVENGEDVHAAAVREMKEETGLTFEPLKVDSMYERDWYSSAGLTDESCGMVYGYAHGEVSMADLEDTEDISVILADRDMVREILKNHECALPAAYHLMHFLHDRDAFAFLQKETEL